MEEFKFLLRRLRTEHGLSQDDLGEMVGVKGVTVGKWEKGSFLPRPPRVRQLARVFQDDISEDQLMAMLGYKSPSPDSLAVGAILASDNPKIKHIMEELVGMPDWVLDLLTRQIEHVLMPMADKELREPSSDEEDGDSADTAKHTDTGGDAG